VTLGAEAATAWADSFLGTLPPAAGQALLAGAREQELAPGQTFYRSIHHVETERLGVVVSGLLRTFRRGADGRQVTLRYASRPRVIGLPAVLGAGAEIEGEALLPSRVVIVAASEFRALARRDATCAWAVAVHMGQLLQETNELLAAHVFMPVRSRVARHLLDWAALEDERLVVRASQQNLADAIGSVREVISRALRQLENEGYVARERRALTVLDPEGLHAVSVGLA
jgi:CRP-like cAMP-binding protein